MNRSAWKPLAKRPQERSVLHYRDLSSPPVPLDPESFSLGAKNATRSLLAGIFVAFQPI